MNQYEQRQIKDRIKLLNDQSKAFLVMLIVAGLLSTIWAIMWGVYGQFSYLACHLICVGACLVFNHKAAACRGEAIGLSHRLNLLLVA